MIICSCNVISDKDIQHAINSLDSHKIPSANNILAALGKDTVCASCAKSIKEQIRKHYYENEV